MKLFDLTKQNKYIAKLGESLTFFFILNLQKPDKREKYKYQKKKKKT